MEALRAQFLPEFLNRIDETIIFHPLNRHEIRRIVDLQLELLRKKLEQQGISLTVTEPARNAMAAQGYDPTYGARPLKRVIQQRIQNPLATELLKGEISRRRRRPSRLPEQRIRVRTQRAGAVRGRDGGRAVKPS